MSVSIDEAKAARHAAYVPDSTVKACAVIGCETNSQSATILCPAHDRAWAAYRAEYRPGELVDGAFYIIDEWLAQTASNEDPVLRTERLWYPL
jgi:hypothetical protein